MRPELKAATSIFHSVMVQPSRGRASDPLGLMVSPAGRQAGAQTWVTNDGHCCSDFAYKHVAPVFETLARASCGQWGAGLGSVVAKCRGRLLT